MSHLGLPRDAYALTSGLKSTSDETAERLFQGSLESEASPELGSDFREYTAKITALDTFSTGKIEGTAGTNAIGRDPDTGEDVLLTTDPSNDETLWDEDVTVTHDITGGVAAGESVGETARNVADAVGDATGNVDFSGLGGVGDALDKLLLGLGGVLGFVVLLVVVYVFGQLFDINVGGE